jgi:hypothetical protein
MRKQPSIPELSRVALTHAHECKGEDRILPEGATGTIVMVYRDGAGYEVEFAEPFHCLVSLRPDEIRRV